MLGERQGMHPWIMEKPSSGLHSVLINQEFSKMDIPLSFMQDPFLPCKHGHSKPLRHAISAIRQKLAANVQLVAIVLSDEQFAET